MQHAVHEADYVTVDVCLSIQ